MGLRHPVTISPASLSNVFFIGHFLQKSPIISGSFAKNSLSNIIIQRILLHNVIQGGEDS